MSNDLHVVIGSGPLGSWTATALLEAGKRVRVVNRSGRAAHLPTDIEAVSGDAMDAASMTKIMHGATSVYQCAQPPYHQWAGNFPRMQAAIIASAAANQSALVVAENLYMYGDPHGAPMTEQTPYGAHTRKGRIRQAMTEALFAAHQSGQIRAASARGADFFGPYDSLSSELLFQPALTGKGINMLGKLDQPHTFTYIPDFGRALALLGTTNTGFGRAWHVPSAPPLTQAALVAQIGEQLGTPLVARGSSRVILSLIGLFNHGVAESVEMLYEWNEPFVMDSSAFTRQFGLAHTPLNEALGATIAWNREQLAHGEAAAVVR